MVRIIRFKCSVNKNMVSGRFILPVLPEELKMCVHDNCIITTGFLYTKVKRDISFLSTRNKTKPLISALYFQNIYIHIYMMQVDYTLHILLSPTKFVGIIIWAVRGCPS